MSANTPRPPIGAIIAALALAEVLTATRATSADPSDLPRGLKELLSAKCDDPTCEACHPATAGKQQDNTMAQAMEKAKEEAEQVHVSDYIEITPDVAELVGMTKPGFDPSSLEGHTRLLAAAFILNVRKLGEQPVNTFPKAAATMTGIRYAENTMLSALQTFASLAGK